MEHQITYLHCGKYLKKHLQSEIKDVLCVVDLIEWEAEFNFATPKSTVHHQTAVLKMVRPTGFEPVTSGSGDQRSIQTELMPRRVQEALSAPLLVSISPATLLSFVRGNLVSLSLSTAGHLFSLLSALLRSQL